jgi:hypothetical protein
LYHDQHVPHVRSLHQHVQQLVLCGVHATTVTMVASLLSQRARNGTAGSTADASAMPDVAGGHRPFRTKNQQIKKRVPRNFNS